MKTTDTLEPKKTKRTKKVAALPVVAVEALTSVTEVVSIDTTPLIEEAAYYIAEQRGFAPGDELSDWLRAEAEIENKLRDSLK